MLKIQFRAMGCEMAAFVDSEGTAAARALACVPGWFETWEQELSRFRPDSALSLLNSASSEQVQAGPVLLGAIEAALNAAVWTGGLVVPNILTSVEQAGYWQSFERMKDQLPDRAPAPAALQSDQREDWKLIHVDFEQGWVQKPVGMRLDLGGVGKGWAAYQAAQLLSAFGPALVDAGGDIAVSGLKSDGSAWPVAIADPFQVHKDLGLLTLGQCGVATSGTDYRRWTRQGKLMHHIIDPRSGQPADTDLVSVSVIAARVDTAEAAAKAILILGSQAGLDWLLEHSELSALLVRQDGGLLYGGNFEQYLWRNEPYAYGLEPIAR